MLKRSLIVLLASSITGCGIAHKELRLDISQPVSIRVVSEEVFRAEFGPGPHYNDVGVFMQALPRCFFKTGSRTIFVNAYAGTDCLLHELCHAAGRSDIECSTINGWR